MNADVEARSHRLDRIGVALLSGLAGVATFLATRHGPVLSPDSVTYLSAARNLVAGHGYTDFTGHAVTTFPPGYSVLLAIGRWAGLSLLMAARVLNSGLFMLVVGLTWLVLRRHTRSRVVCIGATAFVAASQTMLNLSDHAWSEPAFCVLILVFTLLLEDAITRWRTRSWPVALAGVVVGCAFLVRYAATILLVVGVVTLIISHRRDGTRAVATRVAVFIATASLLPLIWIARNAASGTPYLLGPRVASTSGVGGLTRQFTVGLVSLFLPGFSTQSIVLLVALVTPLVASLWFAFRSGDEPRRRDYTLLPTAIFVCLYPPFVVASGRFSGSSIDARLIAPMFPSVVILLAVLLDEILQRGRGELRTSNLRFVQPAVRLVGIGAGSAVLIASAVLFFDKVASDGASAHAYASTSYAESELAESVRALGPGSLVATNRPWALYVGTGRQPIVPSPAPLYPSVSLIPTTVEDLEHQTCTRRVYLAWYGYVAATPPSERVRGLRLHVLRTVNDGTLYRVDVDESGCAS